VSSAWEGSHWRNILLLLGDQPVALRAGARVRVRVAARLAGPQPRYAFETEVSEEAGDESSCWRRVGTELQYPEAAMNVNDAMDALMAGD